MTLLILTCVSIVGLWFWIFASWVQLDFLLKFACFLSLRIKFSLSLLRDWDILFLEEFLLGLNSFLQSLVFGLELVFLTFWLLTFELNAAVSFFLFQSFLGFDSSCSYFSFSWFYPWDWWSKNFFTYFNISTEISSWIFWSSKQVR
jgi:hypothetical protein